jgi:hypothetical protein
MISYLLNKGLKVKIWDPLVNVHEVENELKLYNLLINKYSNNYIFVHDHRHISYNHFSVRHNVEINKEIDYPIFHPNFNYYIDNIDNKYYDLWSVNLLSDNLLDYCMIIENAKEIHISDSAFSCLCPYLNLNNVNSKNIYTCYDIKDYHTSYDNWNIKPP